MTSHAARILKLSPMRVRQLANEGLLKPIVTADGWRLFSRGDVERLAADRRARAHTAKPTGDPR